MILSVIPCYRPPQLRYTTTTTYKYQIKTSPRCTGLESKREYSTYYNAEKAGERMIEKLKSIS